MSQPQLRAAQLVSDRGFPLVFQDIVRVLPVLTVENYLKWYTLFLVDKHDNVTAIEFPEDGFCDHVPYPAAVQALADREGWLVDEQSMEMIVGRFVLEVRQTELADLQLREK